MKKILIFILGIFLCIKLDAQDISIPLSNFLDKELSKFSIPNLEVLIVNKDSILYSKSIGKSSPNSSYYIGSVSKSLTAYGVLQLIEQGKLEFKTKVEKILPEIEFENSTREITIWHLLTHTSGIKKSAGFSCLPTLEEIKNTKHIIANEGVDPLKHEYSNLNYSLLGLIIEKITSLSFGDYMKREVFVPLNMDNSIIGSRDDVAPYLIKHYQYLGPFPVKSKQLNFSKSSIPAGFICSSANDLGSYLKLNLSKGMFDQKMLIDSTLIQSMYKVWNGSDYGYAMGWKQGWYNDNKFYQHLGTTANSYSGIFMIPKKEIGFVFLSNSNSLYFAENIAEGILNILTEGNPKEVSRFEFFLRIAVLAVFLFILLNFIFKFTLIVRGKKSVIKKKSLKDIIIYILLFVSLILMFPIIADIPFVSFLRIQPDIGFLILLSFLLPIILAIIKIVKGKPVENNGYDVHAGA